MTNRSPARNLKPIIFYNDLFHYVEENRETDQFMLFNVYNLNRTFEEVHKEIIAANVGEDITVTSVDDFGVKSDSSSEMEGSYIALGSSIKIKISFKSQKHRDVIEQLRSSPQIKDLTINGFADWVPLDSKSYINIERNSKCERSGNILNTTKLRTFDEDIDQSTLEIAIDEIHQGDIEPALEKLFPGPIITINREVNDVLMKVVVFEVRYSFDEEIGKLFVEVLNSLIKDRNLDSGSKEFVVLDMIVCRLFAVVRNLTYFNEIYGESKIPSWVPFIAQPKVKEVREKFPVNHVPEENYLLELLEITDIDEPLKKLHLLVKRLREEVEVAHRKINGAIRKWKAPEITSNLLFYGGSIASIAIVPSAYFYNDRSFSTASSNRFKISIGCLLSVLLSIWSRKSYHNFHEAIALTRQVNPLLDSTKNSVESLEQCLDRITEDNVNVNNDYKGRKSILKQLFHKFVTINSLVRNGFRIALS